MNNDLIERIADAIDEWLATQAALSAMQGEVGGLREALTEMQSVFCEYHCNTSINGPLHAPECVKARAALAKDETARG